MTDTDTFFNEDAEEALWRESAERDEIAEDDEIRTPANARWLRWLQTLDTPEGDAPEPKRKRRRKPSFAPAIRQARKAGETGTVRVSITDPNGYTTTVASEPDRPQQMVTDDAERLWLERIGKNAAN
jgi:hypothetical protein